jgi:hypothetical protein
MHVRCLRKIIEEIRLLVSDNTGYHTISMKGQVYLALRSNRCSSCKTYGLRNESTPVAIIDQTQRATSGSGESQCLVEYKIKHLLKGLGCKNCLI